MSHNDFLADELNNARHSILECQNDINELERLYFVYKNLSLNLSTQNFSHAENFNSPLEWTYYSILEELVPELNSSTLDTILSADSELKSYITEWIEMDGFIAKLKYKSKPPPNLDCFNSAA
jgi:hypothetical protein